MDAPYNLQAFLHYHRRIFLVMALLCLAVFAGLVVVMRNDFSWSGGFCLGAAAQLLKFRFLDIAVIQRIAVEKRDPAGVQLKAAFVTLLLFGGAAAAVLKLGFNVWAMALGVFLPRLILIADTYLRPNPFADEEVERQDSPVTEGSDTARPESAPTQPTPGQSAERHGDA